MRTLGICVALLLTGGCSSLDSFSFSTGGQLDPSKVYLGRSVIVAPRHELDRYGCVAGPMRCESRGVHFECRCSQ